MASAAPRVHLGSAELDRSHHHACGVFDDPRRARKTIPAETTYLIAVTGYGQGRDVIEAHQAGFDAHLIKPINARTLQDMLEHRGLAGSEQLLLKAALPEATVGAA